MKNAFKEKKEHTPQEWEVMDEATGEIVKKGCRSKFDAKKWVDSAGKPGARYIVRQVR